jgi:long-chain acyl-CoA synthetase
MEATLGRMLAAAAARFGDKPVVVAPDRTLSFVELDDMSDRLAGVLRARGILPGERVTLWIENGWRWMVAYYAALKIGAVVNPCNILLTATEVAFIVTDCGSKLVIAARDKAGLLDGKVSAPVVTDLSKDGFAHSIDSWLAESASSNADIDIWSDAASPCTIGYTSGTTGHPKGAVLSHSTIVLNTAMTSLMHGRTADDIVVSALPCTHVYGNVVMNSAALCGLTLVLLPRFDEREVLAVIERQHATLFEGVPTMFMRLLNCEELARANLSTLRACTVGGQTMPVSKMQEVEQRFGCPLLELWGMTELGGLGTTHPHNGPHRLGSIGVPLPLTQIRVVATDDPDQELPAGEVGEMMVRGPLVMLGYHDNPDATRATIRPDGWMHTGDLVRADAEGYLFVVDRAKEVIISGGYNIYPAEVERIVAQHPSVAMVAVAAQHDDLKGQVPRAFIVPKAGKTCTAQEIMDYCKPHLASYKVPRDITLLDDLPKTSTGKILRRMLATSRN